MGITETRIRPRRRHPMGEITLLLSRGADPESLRTVLQLAASELHDIAVHHFRSEPPGRTMQPTAMVNEVCIRFLEEGTSFKNRRHFFGAVSQAMCRLLVDNARRRLAKRRGGGLRRVDLSEAERIGFERPSELLDFEAALKRLKATEPLWGEIVELRVFGGLSTAEAATLLGIGGSTARKRWTKAKEWLRTILAAPRNGVAISKKASPK